VCRALACNSRDSLSYILPPWPDPFFSPGKSSTVRPSPQLALVHHSSHSVRRTQLTHPLSLSPCTVRKGTLVLGGLAVSQTTLHPTLSTLHHHPPNPAKTTITTSCEYRLRWTTATRSSASVVSPSKHVKSRRFPISCTCLSSHPTPNLPDQSIFSIFSIKLSIPSITQRQPQKS